MKLNVDAMCSNEKESVAVVASPGWKWRYFKGVG